jgi:hypothetical protein
LVVEKKVRGQSSSSVRRRIAKFFNL